MIQPNALLTITMKDNDLGQILDALCVRRDAWRNTELYYHNGTCTEDMLIEDCDGEEEARFLADQYDSIIVELQSQIKKARLVNSISNEHK